VVAALMVKTTKTVSKKERQDEISQAGSIALLTCQKGADTS
jgi:hypothetical protein